MAAVPPDAIEFETAVASAVDSPTPRLMLATAGERWLLVTQSTPEITPEVVPEPVQSRTRTANRRAFFATPQVAPPTVPDTCVPWPLQSFVPLPSFTAVKAPEARPPKSTCVVRMPVSMMYAFTPL